MFRAARIHAAGLVALVILSAAAGPVNGNDEICVDCVQVRVGPAHVIRGPFPDELDAPFTALKLDDGTFRGFSANGSTYAIEGPTLWDMAGERREVLQAGPPGSINDCGRWLTSLTRSSDRVLGFVHQERICDYGPQGHTDKTMAIATSSDDGLTWTDLGTVITGRDAPAPVGITGEGDCTMVDGRDGYLYGYCLRNSDWQTIVARAWAGEPTDWRKYYEGRWDEPGLGGRATAIGFVGTGAGYLQEPGWVAAVATDPWFGGVRLSLSADKVSFVDLDEPLLTIDGSDWNRPAATDLISYATMLNPDNGSNAVDSRFLLAYNYVPPGKGFDSRYLVYHEVSLSVEDEPVAVQVGMALTRWSDPERGSYLTSTGPLTGDRLAYGRDTLVAYMLTRAPDAVASIKLAECSSNASGQLDQLLAEDGSCEPAGYARERTAGWLYASEQPGTVPVYRCISEPARTHFASGAPDCEGLGRVDILLGYGLAP
ncbi:MAG: hypothetical protein KJ944_18780 [Alphaproteobacteria bacterium]|nr:hypothetical protein [Alphaproteobacteria bacterium]MBU2304633.1 hypothetical protein [Alphaproteobacteria bacterium]MBU2369980.1 hypothetical protein [Alphaproteobacteria bacterium]